MWLKRTTLLRPKTWPPRPPPNNIQALPTTPKPHIVVPNSILSPLFSLYVDQRVYATIYNLNKTSPLLQTTTEAMWSLKSKQFIYKTIVLFLLSLTNNTTPDRETQKHSCFGNIQHCAWYVYLNAVSKVAHENSSWLEIATKVARFVFAVVSIVSGRVFALAIAINYNQLLFCYLNSAFFEVRLVTYLCKCVFGGSVGGVSITPLTSTVTSVMLTGFQMLKTTRKVRNCG